MSTNIFLTLLGVASIFVILSAAVCRILVRRGILPEADARYLFFWDAVFTMAVLGALALML